MEWLMARTLFTWPNFYCVFYCVIVRANFKAGEWLTASRNFNSNIALLGRRTEVFLGLPRFRGRFSWADPVSGEGFSWADPVSGEGFSWADLVSGATLGVAEPRQCSRRARW